MAVPTRYRKCLEVSAASKCVITIDPQDSCLLLYPQQEWESIEAKLQSLPSFNRQTRRVQRLLIGHATEVELDTSGRILIPNVLRQYANLEKEIMLVGQGNKFEIWSFDNWQDSCKDWIDQERDDSGSMVEDLKGLSL